MKMNEWAGNLSQSLNKKLAKKFGFKFNTAGLNEQKAQILLSEINKRIDEFKENNSQISSEKNSYYMNLLLSRDHLSNWISEAKYRDPQYKGKLWQPQKRSTEYGDSGGFSKEPAGALSKQKEDPLARRSTPSEYPNVKGPRKGKISKLSISRKKDELSGHEAFEGFDDKRPNPEIVKSVQDEKKRRQDQEKKDKEKAEKNLQNYKSGNVRANWKKVGENIEVSELKVPSKWTKIKHKFAYGSSPRDTVKRVKGDVKNMGARDLSRLHTSYQNEPEDQIKGRNRGSPQDIQKRAIDKEFKKRSQPYIHSEAAHSDGSKIGEGKADKVNFDPETQDVMFKGDEHKVVSKKKVDDYKSKGWKIRHAVKPYVKWRKSKTEESKERKIMVTKTDYMKLKRATELSESGKAVPAKYLEPLKETLSKLRTKRELNEEALRRFFAQHGRTLTEGEVEQAQAILAAKDLVDRLQDMLEDVGSMMNEEMPPLVDSVRDQIGTNQATSFNTAVSGSLSSLLDTIKSTRESIDAATRQLAGEEPGNDMEVPDEVSPEDEKSLSTPDLDVGGEEEGDGFDGIDAAVGGEEPLGREKR